MTLKRRVLYVFPLPGQAKDIALHLGPIPYNNVPMRIHERISPYIEAALRLIYPASCGVCSGGLEIHEQSLCQSCGEDLRNRRFDFQTSCLETHFSAVTESWALYPYESPVKDLLTAIKFSKKRWLVRSFREDLQVFGSALASEQTYDMIVPIPLDRSRLLDRQFNQAELFARLLSEAMKIPAQKALIKRHRTPAQSGLNQKEREINLYQAFRVTKPQCIRGKRILLVDDVLTTGATVREAARTLREQGAKRVDAFALACTSRKP